MTNQGLTVESAKAILRSSSHGKQTKGIATAFLKSRGIIVTPSFLAKKNGHEKKTRRGRHG